MNVGTSQSFYISFLIFVLLLIDRYRCAQMYKLLESGFRFISDEETAHINQAGIDLLSDVGYFVECDLYYPEEIHKVTKDFPLCPENMEITYDMLSPFQKMCLQKIYGRKSYKQKKLTASFLPRNKM